MPLEAAVEADPEECDGIGVVSEATEGEVLALLGSQLKLCFMFTLVAFT